MKDLPPNWRELVLAEASSWLRTPYHHMADVKGAGVDCAMFLVRAFVDTGLVPPFDPRPYAAQWYHNQGEERYLGWVEQYCHRVDVPKPADIAMYRFGRCAAHGAIILDATYMIHSYLPAGQVEIIERNAPLKHGAFDSFWSLD